MTSGTARPHAYGLVVVLLEQAAIHVAHRLRHDVGRRGSPVCGSGTKISSRSTVSSACRRAMFSRPTFCRYSSPGGVDANRPKRALYDDARQAGIEGRSKLTKQQLADALQAHNDRETARARAS